MGKRALFGALYAAVLIGLLGFTPFGTVLLMVFTILLLNEGAKLLRIDPKPIRLLAVLCMLFLAKVDFGTAQELVLTSVGLSILLAFGALRAAEPASEMRKTLFLVAYIWLPMTLVIQQSWKFPELILFIFVMIWASDTFAYLAGRSFGKRQFAPKLSPKKTIEGFVGGIVGTLLTCGILNHYLEVVPDTVALAMALATSIAAPFGDLIASALKREADVKDSGVFLPGHGGALDRLDSFLTAAPLSVLIYSYLI